MAFHSVESVPPLQTFIASGLDQCWIGVPPQLSLIRPCGTVPPSESKTSLYVNQQTALM